MQTRSETQFPAVIHFLIYLRESDGIRTCIFNIFFCVDVWGVH